MAENTKNVQGKNKNQFDKGNVQRDPAKQQKSSDKTPPNKDMGRRDQNR